MNRDTFTASHVAHDSLAANRVATSRPVYEQIAMSLHADRIVILIPAEDPPHHACKCSGLICQVFRDGLAGSWGKTPQYLSRRIFAIANSSHEVIRTPHAVVGCNLLQLLVFDVLQRYSILSRLFLYQLASNFYGALSLMHIQPVLDFVTGTR